MRRFWGLKRLAYGKGELALIEYAKHPGTTPLLEAVKTALELLNRAQDNPVEKEVFEKISPAEETMFIKIACETLLKEMLGTA